MGETYAILQTGRLGDLWFTVPLADYLHARGNEVEVWYDAAYGNPFTYFPSVRPRATKLPRFFRGDERFARIVNSAAQQLALYTKLKRSGRKVIWNQIYPFRIGAYRENKPYPVYWYKRHPHVDFRRARTTLPRKDGNTILLFASSVSLRIDAGSALTEWIETNLSLVEAHTGYRTVYVPPPGSPDHPRFETWRGDLDAYQALIAECGLVFGISTSAHVLGQLLGKPVVALYPSKRTLVDTIGDETVRLFAGETIDAKALVRLPRAPRWPRR